MKIKLVILIFLFAGTLQAFDFEWIEDDPQSDLMRDLMIVDCVNQCLCDKMPVTYNNLLQGGYINMPSALMGEEGECGAGFSYVHPYRNYNLRFQFNDRIEFSGNYRVFKGVDDPILTPMGFGDMSDKGANVKVQILKPEDSDYILPAVSVGFDDFLGTRSFKSKYIVLTQVFRKYNIEMSLGYGKQRIRNFFGGVLWMPFRKSPNCYLKGLALCAEYDAIPYKSETREPHPDGRTQKSPINYGLKYRLWDMIDLTASYIRGERFSFNFSTFYNFGYTCGFIAKKDDPLPYNAPVIRQPLGPLRPTDCLVQDLVYPFEDQGMELMEAWISYDYNCRKILRLSVQNCAWRYESEIRCRLSHLLAALIPSDISHVIVAIETVGFPIQEYHFPMEFVRRFGDKMMGPFELRVLSPLCDYSSPSKCYDEQIFQRKYPLWCLDIYPKFLSFFGSAKGKFKYALGVHVGLFGYLWKDVYYSVLLGYIFSSNLYDVKDVDRLNPSQILNVRTDIINYLKQDGITVDHAYLQKNWNMGCAWFSRLSMGLFEEEYGGVAGEILWFPVKSCFAFGFEAAILRKRNFTGIGFSDKFRKLNGFVPTFRHFLASQVFVNGYFKFEPFDIDVYLKGGKFLANDWGLRTEVSRFFPSGFRASCWFTYTNAKDRVNGHRYHDHGVAISIPLDIFKMQSSRHRWNYGMSAWLRDVGQTACTGDELYYMIKDHREKPLR